MNLVLFEPGEWKRPLPPQDVRARHLVDILRLTPGDRFAAGEVGGAVGTLAWVGSEPEGLLFADAEWTGTPPPPSRVRLLIGTPRPPTARRLLKDLTTMGAAELHFVATDLGEKSYLTSSLWEKGEFRIHLLEGASQARTTLLPTVQRHQSLRRALHALEDRPGPKVWFDEGGAPWLDHSAHQAVTGELWLALGPERGWSAAERELLTRSWQLAGLGQRVLRTETACSLALGTAVMRGW